jgi:hypothetical protein
MTAYTVETWSNNHPYSTSIALSPVKTVQQTLDFSKYLSSSATAVGALANDTVKVIPIKAGWFVIGCKLKVLTAEGGTLTVDVGDSATADGYFNNTNCNTTTDAFSFNATTTPTFGVGKYYASADDLIVLLNNNADAAVIQLELAYIDTNMA